MRFLRLSLIVCILLALCAVPASATWYPPTDRSIIGVEWDSGDPSPDLKWIDASGTAISPSPDFNNHVLWGNVKRVTVSDAGVVTRDINPRGDNLDLTGASGAVMVEIPKFYAKSEKVGDYYRWWISPDPATGFELHPAFVQRGGTERDYIYVGAYEATLRVLPNGDLALSSRTGEQPWTGGTGARDGMFAIGFSSGSSQPTIGKTIAGASSGSAGQLVAIHVASGSWGSGNAAGTMYLKQTTGSFSNAENLQIDSSTVAKAATATANANIAATINTFEGAGEAIGSGWGDINVWAYSAIRLLYTIEQATWASQETTGLGIVSKASGSGFAGENTGYDGIDAKLSEYGTWGDTSDGYSAVSYRGMENLWGNTWTWITGFTSTESGIKIVKQDGTGSLSVHPLVSGSYETSTARVVGNGYWKLLAYEELLQYHFIPSVIGGGADEYTYGTDYHYGGTSDRVLLAGGGWDDGRRAGLGCLNSDYAASGSYRGGGARLEFVGANTLYGNAPIARYTYTPKSGNTIEFEDTSTETPGWWLWNFGDGSATSAVQNPQHTYSSPGTYNVTLTAWNIYGSNTSVSTVSVSPMESSFTVDVNEGNAPLTVNFTDESSGDITEWLWNFGDGSATSAVQNPAHTYANSGVYTVNLTVSNAYSSDTSSEQITVLTPPLSGFITNISEGNAPLTVNFTDTSTGNVTGWSWVFGDGDTSQDRNPIHTYTDSGVYNVSLNASNKYGYNTSSSQITVLVPPISGFSTNVTEGNAPLTVSFTDSSTGNVTGWSWSFGDGGTSQDRNPIHTYVNPDTYTVNLTVSNAYSSNTSSTQITVLPPPIASFYALPLSGDIPLEVQFTDTSTGNITGRKWDFGDNSNSTDQHPQHTYTAAGIYTVSLTVMNSYGENTSIRSQYIVATTPDPPIASFTADPEEGNAPLEVLFTDTSLNLPDNWHWSFGDGSNSTDQHPSHTYTAAGIYTVTLNASNEYGYGITSSQITVLAPPVSVFSTNVTEGNAPLTVSFTDSSTGNVTGWSWSFGDDVTSSDHSPVHTYANPGTYTATLTVNNAYGSNSSTTQITVLAPPVSGFSTNVTEGNAPLTVSFTDSSTGNVTGWSWSFGDGAISSDRNPSHTYVNSGTYTATLTVSNAYGSNSSTTQITVLIPPTASFSATPTSGLASLEVHFTDSSTGNVTGWSWSFGDGATSSDRNPTHTYTNPGTYTVTLTASNTYGSNTITKTNHITVYTPPVAQFTAYPTSGLSPLEVSFSDSSAGGVTSWHWSFGDGKTSSLKNPSHTYVNPGTYTVTLTATNPHGSNTITKTNHITVYTPPVAQFTAYPTSGLSPLEVSFSDSSAGGVTSWHWSFGDGSYSSAQHPTHTYANPGTYTVTLTATNPHGSDSLTRSGYITVYTPPTASFTATPTSGKIPLTVHFSDTSYGDITSWHWSFGDGKTSSLKNPSHTYSSAGTYTVRLTVSNPYGSDTETQTNLILAQKEIPRYPESDNIETRPATQIGISKATLRGSLLSNEPCLVWFEYGTASNSYGITTGARTVKPGEFSENIKGFPLIAGQTYYYRAACLDGYGLEESFTLPTVTPAPVITYGEAAEKFIHSFENEDEMVDDMMDAVWSPYISLLGALFWALIIGAVFINLAMKGHSIAIPALLVMIIGGALWSLVPPEFTVIAQAFIIIGVSGMIYYIYNKRKM